MSYSQIKEVIPAGKGTLNYWLRDYPLTEDQRARLYEKRYVWVENFRETMRKKREERLELIYEDQKEKIGRLSERDLFLIGIGLYWGEGQKRGGSLSVSNSDPDVIKFWLVWLEKCCGIRRRNNRVSVYTHFYSDMDVEKELEFWRRILRVRRSQFARSYIKQSKRTDLDYRTFGHGTCRIQVANVKIKQEVMATIRLISELDS